MLHSRYLEDSRETFADLARLQPGTRHAMPSFGGGSMSILPFGENNDHAHVFFREHPAGTIAGSMLLTPSRIEALAAEGLPLNHAWRSGAARAETPNATPADVLRAVAAEMKEDPKEADPKAKHPESVQSPAEAEIFKRLDTKELVRQTLDKVFAGNGFKPGSLIDGTYDDAQKTRPLREIIYYVDAQGQPILHAYFNIFYGAQKQPVLIISRTVENISSTIFRRVMIEQSLESTTQTAGLTLGYGSSSPVISSGPKAGDVVHSLGQPLGGGPSFAFNAAYTKTHLRLRLQAELEVQQELGKFITTVTVIPRA